MPKQIVAIDSQRLDAMQNCAFYYDTKFNKSLVSINTPHYIERGSLIHEMLAVYYNLRKHRSRWMQNGKTYRDIVNSCIIAGRHKANKMQLALAEVEETISVFQQYVDHWENDGWDNILGVENVGSKVLWEDDDLIILYEVKIDLILRISSMIIPIDHKSLSSRRDPNELSNQFKGYCWFVGGHNLIVNEIGFQKTVKPVDKFRRHTLSFPQAIIEEWIENTVFWVKQSLSLQLAKIAPRNYTSCDKFSGCEMKRICIAEPGDLREYRIREGYKERVWDVGANHL